MAKVVTKLTYELRDEGSFDAVLNDVWQRAVGREVYWLFAISGVLVLTAVMLVLQIALNYGGLGAGTAVLLAGWVSYHFYMRFWFLGIITQTSERVLAEFALDPVMTR